MKRIWKVWAVFGIIAVIGAACILIGRMCGGREEAADLLAQEVYSRAGKSVESDFWESFDLDPDEKLLEQIDPLTELVPAESGDYENRDLAHRNEVSRLLVRAGGCELTITQTDADTFGIVVEDADKLRSYLEDGNLSVISGYEKKNGQKHYTKMTLYIPADAVLDEIEIDVGGCILQAGDLRAHEIVVDAGAGSFTINGLEADKLDAELAAGEMKVTDASVTDLVVEGGVGAFSWQGAVAGSVEAECGMGRIALSVEGQQEDFDYHTDCVAGDIVIGGISGGGSVGEHAYRNQADKYMDLSCAMGEIAVDFYEKGGNENEQ